MMYPLVRELAADGIPVAVTCRVLKIARQPYYRWLADPVTDAELEAAYLANALFDAHRDDPEFGYRYLADEARDAGHTACDRTAWRICSANGWWSAFGKKRGKNGKPGSPVHDDLVERDFTANRPNQLWLADITEHKTAEGKLYLCAIKDVHSNRIVCYSIDSRMKSRLAVDALRSAVARRGQTAGCILHTDHGVQAIQIQEVRPGSARTRHGRLDGPRRRRRRQRGHGELLRTTAEERPGPPSLGHSPGAADGDRGLDRTHLSPEATPSRAREIDPHRVRDHHDHTSPSGCLTQPVTYRCISP